MISFIRRAGCALVAAGMLTAGAPAASWAQDQVNVAIGQRGLWDTMVIPAGIEQGFFADEDIEVDVTWTRGGAETLQAVITGSVQFAIANGMLGVLSAYEKGAPIRIVSAQMTGAPDLYWYVKADSDIQSMSDMDDRSMGFSRPGSSTNLVALELGQAAGVEPDYTPTGGISETRTQVMSGQVDAGWSVPPMNLDLVSQGEIRIIARGSDVPHLSEQTIRVNVVNADFLEENPEVVERFMRAYTRALDWMYDSRDEAVQFFADFNEIDVETAREALDFYPREALAPAPIEGIETSVEQAMAYDRLEAPLSEEQVDELVQLRPSGQ